RRSAFPAAGVRRRPTPVPWRDAVPGRPHAVVVVLPVVKGLPRPSFRRRPEVFHNSEAGHRTSAVRPDAVPWRIAMARRPATPDWKTVRVPAPRRGRVHRRAG